jgi:hypothetical protein
MNEHYLPFPGTEDAWQKYCKITKFAPSFFYIFNYLIVDKFSTKLLHIFLLTDHCGGVGELGTVPLSLSSIPQEGERG